MRNPYGPQAILERAYLENATLNQQIPTLGLPALLPESRPVHAVVKVDVFMPGCPPSADRIFAAINELLSGQAPDVDRSTSFG